MSRNGSPQSPVTKLRAFGMDIEADFKMTGAMPSRHVGDGRSLSLVLASREQVELGFPPDAERIAELTRDSGDLLVSVDSGGDEGYLAYAFDFGRARLAPDGRTALIAPFEEPTWIWQRYLTGQLLPLAGLLQGFEVFHACVLGHEGRAIAVVANSGIGKTTTAMHLSLRGLDFMSDDVLVLEPLDNGVRAHPGVSLANLRPGNDDLLAALESAGLAEPIGTDPRGTRLSIRRSDVPLPLSALFVLNRFVDERELKVEHLTPVEPRVLLAATFNFSVKTPERLARQLDVCSRVDRHVSVFRVSCGIGVTAADVAEAILEWAVESSPC